MPDTKLIAALIKAGVTPEEAARAASAVPVPEPEQTPGDGLDPLYDWRCGRCNRGYWDADTKHVCCPAHEDLEPLCQECVGELPHT